MLRAVTPRHWGIKPSLGDYSQHLVMPTLLVSSIASGYANASGQLSGIGYSSKASGTDSLHRGFRHASGGFAQASGYVPTPP